MRIACIGVGNMGGAVARRAAGGPFDVVVHDPDPEAVRRCVAAGAAGASSLEDAVSDVDVVLTSLPTTAAVLSVVEQVVAAASPDTAVMDISTIDPLTARQAERTCADRGLPFVACALGKTPAHAEQGAIPLFVGGDAEVVDRLRPLLDHIGERTFLFDDVEGATTIKLVSNFIGMAHVAVLAEGLALARRAGITSEQFAEALADTGAHSFQFDVRLPWMLEGDYAARFGVDLAAKDVGLTVDAAQTWGVEVPVGAAALHQLRRVSDLGYGAEDVVALCRLFDPEPSGGQR